MKLILKSLALALLITLLPSCNEEDPFSLPYDMASLNMYCESLGKTLLGETDIYINDDMNFTTAGDYWIADYGQVLDLGHIEEEDPDIFTLVTQAAVTPDEGYLAFLRDDCLRFPSGKVGIATRATYYRIWIDEWINDEQNKKQHVGAKVNFAQYTPRQFDLPVWNSVVAGISDDTRQATITVKRKGCEPMLPDDSPLSAEVTTNKSSKTVITVTAPLGTPAGNYPIFLRVKNSYTKVLVSVF